MDGFEPELSLIICTQVRSHVMGGAASSSSRPNGPAPSEAPGPTDNKPDKPPKRVAKQKTVKEQADAALKKGAVKIDEGEGIGSLLRRSGVHLGLHNHAVMSRDQVKASICNKPLGDLRGEAMAAAAVKDVDPHFTAMVDARGCLKKGLDAGVDDSQLQIQVDNLLHYITKFDDQVRTAKRSIPKVVKPKKKAAAAPAPDKA